MHKKVEETLETIYFGCFDAVQNLREIVTDPACKKVAAAAGTIALAGAVVAVAVHVATHQQD